MSFSAILDQPVAVRALKSALAQNRLASAYLFEGPSGVGKHLAATALAKAVIARGDSAIERRIDRLGHPDFRVFGPRDDGYRNLPAETLRSEILPLTHFAPFEANA